MKLASIQEPNLDSECRWLGRTDSLLATQKSIEIKVVSETFLPWKRNFQIQRGHSILLLALKKPRASHSSHPKQISKILNQSYTLIFEFWVLEPRLVVLGAVSSLCSEDTPNGDIGGIG